MRTFNPYGWKPEAQALHGEGAPVTVFAFRLCPEINNGFGPWFHGMQIRRWQSDKRHAHAIAHRLSRLYRVRVSLDSSPVDDAGVVSCKPWNHEGYWTNGMKES